MPHLCWVDQRVSPLILEAHMFLHVLHHHHPITALFYVPLNERESHGTATNGCRCTVIVAEIFQSSSAESHLALATQISTSTEYGKTPVQKLQLFLYCSPQNLHLCNSNFATLFTYNSTEITPDVSITSQHVAHNTIDKCQHVATAVAGLICNVGAFLASRLHCYFQWHEGSYVRSHNMLILQKETCKIQPNLDWNGSFNWN